MLIGARRSLLKRPAIVAAAGLGLRTNLSAFWSLEEASGDRIDQVAAETTRAIDLLDRLDHTTLAKAFRGDLVPKEEDDQQVDLN